MLRLLTMLYMLKLLSPFAVYRLVYSICRHGINTMALLDFAARTYADNIAIVDDHETLSYKQLLKETECLAQALRHKYQVDAGQKVVILAKNHAVLVKCLFALSRLGADIYLLNAEMSPGQFENLAWSYNS